jgi:hypothetical protein
VLFELKKLDGHELRHVLSYRERVPLQEVQLVETIEHDSQEFSQFSQIAETEVELRYFPELHEVHVLGLSEQVLQFASHLMHTF